MADGVGVIVWRRSGSTSKFKLDVQPCAVAPITPTFAVQPAAAFTAVEDQLLNQSRFASVCKAFFMDLQWRVQLDRLGSIFDWKPTQLPPKYIPVTPPLDETPLDDPRTAPQLLDVAADYLRPLASSASAHEILLAVSAARKLLHIGVEKLSSFAQRQNINATEQVAMRHASAFLHESCVLILCRLPKCVDQSESFYAHLSDPVTEGESPAPPLAFEIAQKLVMIVKSLCLLNRRIGVGTNTRDYQLETALTTLFGEAATRAYETAEENLQSISDVDMSEQCQRLLQKPLAIVELMQYYSAALMEDAFAPVKAPTVCAMTLCNLLLQDARAIVENELAITQPPSVNTALILFSHLWATLCTRYAGYLAGTTISLQWADPFLSILMHWLTVGTKWFMKIIADSAHHDLWSEHPIVSVGNQMVELVNSRAMLDLAIAMQYMVDFFSDCAQTLVLSEADSQHTRMYLMYLLNESLSCLVEPYFLVPLTKDVIDAPTLFFIESNSKARSRGPPHRTLDRLSAEMSSSTMYIEENGLSTASDCQTVDAWLISTAGCKLVSDSIFSVQPANFGSNLIAASFRLNDIHTLVEMLPNVAASVFAAMIDNSTTASDPISEEAATCLEMCANDCLQACRRCIGVSSRADVQVLEQSRLSVCPEWLRRGYEWIAYSDDSFLTDAVRTQMERSIFDCNGCDDPQGHSGTLAVLRHKLVHLRLWQVKAIAGRVNWIVRSNLRALGNAPQTPENILVTLFRHLEEILADLAGNMLPMPFLMVTERLLSMIAEDTITLVLHNLKAKLPVLVDELHLFLMKLHRLFLLAVEPRRLQWILAPCARLLQLINFATPTLVSLNTLLAVRPAPPPEPRPTYVGDNDSDLGADARRHTAQTKASLLVIGQMVYRTLHSLRPECQKVLKNHSVKMFWNYPMSITGRDLESLLVTLRICNDSAGVALLMNQLIAIGLVANVDDSPDSRVFLPSPAQLYRFTNDEPTSGKRLLNEEELSVWVRGVNVHRHTTASHVRVLLSVRQSEK